MATLSDISTAQQTATLAWIALDQISSSIKSRELRESGVVRLIESMERGGFLLQYPLAVSVLEDGTYKLLAGHHRQAAARRLDLETVPALLYTDLTSDDEWRVAVETNRAHEAATLPTFVDDAELVWKLIETGRKQEDVAGIMGWSREKVAQYNGLAKISPDAWQVVVTSFQESGNNATDEEVTGNVTQVTTIFGERILRDLVQLTPPQQLELVRLLVKDPKAKDDYRKRAARYKARNALTEEARRLLKGLPVDFLDYALAEIGKGQYDAEFAVQKAPGPKFQNLIQQCRDDHAKKQNYTLHLGDLLAVSAELEPDSMDYIITDPPYGKDALETYAKLAQFAARHLKSSGSLFVMSGQSYLPQILTALSATLTYHWCLCYSTPGGQAVQLWQREVNTFWKPILWFTKGEYEGKWVGDVVKSAVNDNDKQHHKWGQSESGMLDLINRVTQPGDYICDPFMGAGTTGVIALRTGRKFRGIDQDEEAYTTAEQRLQGAV